MMTRNDFLRGIVELKQREYFVTEQINKMRTIAKDLKPFDEYCSESISSVADTFEQMCIYLAKYDTELKDIQDTF